LKLFELMAKDEHEQVVTCYDASTNLRAILALHCTTLGPALGGCRMWGYESATEALEDALRLSKSMTLRASIAGCDLGGGAAVLWGDPKKDKNEAYFRALGRFVEGLKGKFILTTELGVSVDDLVHIKKETQYVAALPEILGGSGDTGQTTALGIYYGMRSAVKEIFNHSSLQGLSVAIEGAGNLGTHLVEILRREEKDVRIAISDIDYDKMKNIQDRHPDVKLVSSQELLELKCDILAPCAMGGIITGKNVKKLKCRIIAGGATNILESENLVIDLFKKGIFFAPDFVINTGEVIQVDDEMKGLPREKTLESLKKIGVTISDIAIRSREDKVPPHTIALRSARERIARIGKIKHILC
jgi:leucine dehydrogenase